MIGEALLLFLVFLALVFVGVPVGYALGISAVGSFIFQWHQPTGIVNLRMVNGVAAWSFLAVPFFILAGELMSASGITDRLVRLMRLLVGNVHGGLSHVVVIVNVIMAGISGSALADASATGGVLIPSMKLAGYPPAYAAAIVAAAATIGPIIPPSIPMVILGLVANISIGRLFLGGVIPGVIMGLFLLVAGYIQARRRDFPRDVRFSTGEIGVGFVQAIPALMIPVVIVGGIVRGIFDATEASVIAVIASLLIGGLIYRKAGFLELRHVLGSSVRTTASVMFIVATSTAFGAVIALFQLGPKLAAGLQALTSNTLILLLVINIALLILGATLETIPVLLIFLPILIPVVGAYGIDPVHFGVMAILNLMIGLLMPPGGLAMLLMCRMAGVTVAEFWREVWPFFIALLLALFIVTVFPPAVLWLPNMIMGPGK